MKVVQDSNNAQEQQENLGNLVDVNYEQKVQPKMKPTKKKVQRNFQEQQIDHSKIQTEKQQQIKKPVIQSWVPKQDIQRLVMKDFNKSQQQHHFESLYEDVNQQIKQKIDMNPPIMEVGLMKFVPLEDDSNKSIQPPTQSTELKNISVDSTEKKASKYVSLQDNRKIPVSSTAQTKQLTFKKKEQPTFKPMITEGETAMNFINSKQQFMALEKTPQQLKMEQMQKKEPKKVTQNWTKKTNDSTEIKFNAGEIKFTNSKLGTNNFAPLQKTEQQLKMDNKQEQQMTLQSKAEIEERKKKRQINEKQTDKKPNSKRTNKTYVNVN